MNQKTLSLLLALCSLLWPHANAWAQQLPREQPWSFGTSLSSTTYSASTNSKGQAFRAGAVDMRLIRRWGAWRASFDTEFNLWRSEDVEDESDFFGAMLSGFGLERVSLHGALRTRISAGLAVLLEGSETDERWGTGFYLDVHPVGFRWPFEFGALGLDPLSFVVIVPEARGIPIVDVQYRTTFYMEFNL